MTTQLKRTTLKLAINNPAQLPREILIEQFVAHQDILERLLKELRRAAKGREHRHQLLQAPRGMGKTTMLLRLAYAIEDDAELSQKWLPLIFPEEQYNVSELSDFWVNCLNAACNYLDERNRWPEAQELEAFVAALPDEEAARAEQALQKLTAWADAQGRGLVLLADNLNLILDRLKKEHWALRGVMAQEKRLFFVGASSVPVASTYLYEGAFYDYFTVEKLYPLNEQQARTLTFKLAEMNETPHVKGILDNDPGRFAAIYLLTGGNLRTLVLLYEVLATEDTGRVVNDLESLLDRVSPLYKAIADNFAPRLQKVMDALALHWHPMTAAEVAAATRLDVNNASAQLDRLINEGYVEKVAYAREPGVEIPSKLDFQVAERFFNIWYLMRVGRQRRRRLIWLIEFIRLFYGDQELERRARRYAQLPQAGDAGELRTHADLARAFAASEYVRDEELKKQLGENYARCRKLAAELEYAPNRQDLQNQLVEELKDARAVDVQETLESPIARAWELRLRADVQYNRGEYEQAMTTYRQAIELNPGDYASKHMLSYLLHVKLAKYDEAEIAYHQAIAENKQFARPYNGLAYLYYEQNHKLEEAEKLARQAIELNISPSELVNCSHTLACILTRLQKWDEAADLARHFIMSGDTEFQKSYWSYIVDFFHEATRTGHAAEAAVLLEEIKDAEGVAYSERWLPLYQALQAAAGSKTPLLRLAPEVKRPAEEMLKLLLPEGFPPAPPAPAPRRKLGRVGRVTS